MTEYDYIETLNSKIKDRNCELILERAAGHIIELYDEYVAKVVLEHDITVIGIDGAVKMLEAVDEGLCLISEAADEYIIGALMAVDTIYSRDSGACIRNRIGTFKANIQQDCRDRIKKLLNVREEGDDE
jgi:hypothetical protein